MFSKEAFKKLWFLKRFFCPASFSPFLASLEWGCPSLSWGKLPLFEWWSLCHDSLSQFSIPRLILNFVYPPKFCPPHCPHCPPNSCGLSTCSRGLVRGSSCRQWAAWEIRSESAKKSQIHILNILTWNCPCGAQVQAWRPEDECIQISIWNHHLINIRYPFPLVRQTISFTWRHEEGMEKPGR